MKQYSVPFPSERHVTRERHWGVTLRTRSHFTAVAEGSRVAAVHPIFLNNAVFQTRVPHLISLTPKGAWSLWHDS